MGGIGGTGGTQQQPQQPGMPGMEMPKAQVNRQVSRRPKKSCNAEPLTYLGPRWRIRKYGYLTAQCWQG